MYGFLLREHVQENCPFFSRFRKCDHLHHIVNAKGEPHFMSFFEPRLHARDDIRVTMSADRIFFGAVVSSHVRHN